MSRPEYYTIVPNKRIPRNLYYMGERAGQNRVSNTTSLRKPVSIPSPFSTPSILTELTKSDKPSPLSQATLDVEFFKLCVGPSAKSSGILRFPSVVVSALKILKFKLFE